MGNYLVNVSVKQYGIALKNFESTKFDTNDVAYNVKIHPSITSVTVVGEGPEIVIKGTAFGNIPTNVVVYYGGFFCNILSSTPTQMTR